MSEVPFDRYDEEFLSLSDQVKSRISKLQSTLGESTNHDSDLKLANNLLSQCDDLLKQMQIEARSVDDASCKRELMAKVRVCKANLANLKDDFSSAKASVERDALVGSRVSGDLESGSSKFGGKNKSHRERLLEQNDQISGQNDKLGNARRIIAETEDVAMEITSELSRNREKIESAHGRVRDVSGLTNQARRIVQSMSRREVQQKLIMYFFAFMMVVVVIVILYAMGK
mmetsp:Transcript_37075/g.43132  ORF Transcript_37075/g.43132 Transcript_37075/m.43132 type:complete len:229 (-) Transcript_37075:61-747(-)|eukprot:CAMPEP_0171325116 /NCGR_PEP_ID=MMETSP0816-20121228/116608_1 /TAXON_ID=420281 /ORGANISM="Proboscia inermis, Strain CCAP1064/1" /LENGTH=228 /DNA_ID=CAMNT_0011824211 /DNA_START=161 /DNA_END=847 /DNA_ORIENTATION=-